MGRGVPAPGHLMEPPISFPSIKFLDLLYIYICVYIYVCVYMCVCMYVYVYVCVCMCMYACVCVFLTQLELEKIQNVFTSRHQALQ